MSVILLKKLLTELSVVRVLKETLQISNLGFCTVYHLDTAADDQLAAVSVPPPTLLSREMQHRKASYSGLM